MKNTTFNHKGKLLQGLIRLPIGILIVFFLAESDRTHIEKQFMDFGQMYVSKALCEIAFLFLTLFVLYKGLKFTIVGGLQVLSYKQRLTIMGEWGDGPGTGPSLRYNEGGYKNIEQAIRYREAAMAGMNSADAARYLNSTSRLDVMRDSYNNSGPNTQRAASFTNARMAGLNDYDKVRYIQGKIK